MPAMIWSRPFRCPFRLSKQSTVSSLSITSTGPFRNGNATELSRRIPLIAARTRGTANDPVREHHVALVADEAAIRQARGVRGLVLRIQADRCRSWRFEQSNGRGTGNRLARLAGFR